jgi:hypothetical protein
MEPYLTHAAKALINRSQCAALRERSIRTNAEPVMAPDLHRIGTFLRSLQTTRHVPHSAHPSMISVTWPSPSV